MIARNRLVKIISFLNLPKMSVSNSNRFKVFVTQPIPDQALKILQDANLDIQINQEIPLKRDTLLESVEQIDALFCTLNEKIDKELLDKAGNRLKVIATCSVGYDHIDINECKSRKIPVGYTPGVLTDAVAEYAIAVLLALARRIPEGIQAARSGEWSTWKIMWMCGKSLKDSNVGIFGLGRIGLAIAKRLEAFGVNKILYNNRNRNQEADSLNYEYTSFDGLLSQSDFVICCCAATQQTTGIFNRNAFSKMKKDSIFVNISRGIVVNQDDLYEALSSGTIGAAALDVTTPEPLPINHKLYELKNCLISPHICSAETATRIKMAKITAENIVKGVNYESLLFNV